MAFTDHTILYAHWAYATYTITFNPTGGTVSPTTAKTGDGWMLAVEPTPTRSGYTFDGWYTAETGGTEVTTHTAFSADATVYARWVEGEVPTYTITFDANGGTVTPKSGTTTAHGTLSSLPTPTRNGYTFTGWFSALANGEVVTEHTEFFTDFTIYAHWKINTFTITFDPTGGTVNPRTATTGDDGRLASEPTPTRAGYTFDGWYTTAATGGTEVTTSTVFTANTTVYARWVAGTVPTYTITFDASSGTVTPKSGVTTAHGTLPSLPTPTRTGYTFAGWFTAATGGTAVSEGTIFTANGTIYAHWETKTFTVTFSSQGGSAVDEQTVAPGGLAKKPTNPTRTGYAFGDWYQDVAYTRVWHFDTDAVTEDITLFAKWVFTITFNAGEGGRVNPPTANTDANGKLASLPEPTRDGYTFDGWATAPTGGTPVTTNTVFRAHTTIHAHWMVGNINKFDITLDANGEEAWITFDEGVTKVKTIVIHTNAHGTVEDLVHFPELINVGNIPLGWFTSATGGTEVKMDAEVNGVVVQGTKFAANTTIYAHWKPQNWNVTFNSAGPEVDQQHIGHHGKVNEGKADAGSRGANITFKGWYKDADYSIPWDFNDSVVTSDLTLYAKWIWTGANRTISLRPSNGSWVDGSGTGNKIVTLTGEGFRLEASAFPPVARADYEFAGWYSSSLNGQILTPEYLVTSNTEFTVTSTTLYAGWYWIGDSYTVTFDAAGGTVEPPFGLTGEGFILASMPVPTRSDYIFNGWYTARDGGDYALVGRYAANTTIYAHWTLDTRSTFTDSRNHKTYKVLDVNGKKWFAENLNYNGTENGENEIGVCYDNNPANCEIYGRLYTLTEAREACPGGWHLADTAEWRALTTSVGGSVGAAPKLRAAGYWPNTTYDYGTNESGFSALPGGQVNDRGAFTNLNTFARIWRAEDNLAFAINANGTSGALNTSHGTSSSAPTKASVRCVAND